MVSDERVERYELLGELATGGMATVYYGRQHGPFGFARTVAIKSMHPHFAKDEGFRAMFVDEATLTARIRHPNVVPTLDIVCAETRLLIVMEYVDGLSLASLLIARIKLGAPPIAPSIVSSIICDALEGLHAAHELTDDDGRPLHVIHRDVSPQNIHVGLDGLTRVLDFGVAKAASHRYVTQNNEIKGKLPYMSPQQLCGETLDRRTDVYAAGVVLWEALTGRRLFSSTNDGELVRQILEAEVGPPSFVADDPVAGALDRVVLKALSRDAGERFTTAAEMGRALAEAVPPAPRSAVSALVRELGEAELSARARRLKERKSNRGALEPEARLVADVLTHQATQSTVTRRDLPAPRRGRITLIAGVLATLTTFTGAAFVVGSRTRDGAARSVGPEASVALPRSSADASTDTEVTPGRTPAESASASARPAPSDATVPKTAAPPSGNVLRPPQRPGKTGGRASGDRPGVDCRVPYVIDSNGDRHYRAECVE